MVEMGKSIKALAPDLWNLLGVLLGLQMSSAEYGEITIGGAKQMQTTTPFYASRGFPLNTLGVQKGKEKEKKGKRKGKERIKHHSLNLIAGTSTHIQGPNQRIIHCN